MATSLGIVSGLKHPAVQAARALNRPAGRAAQGRYLVEGEKLVRLALASPSRVEAIFVAEGEGTPWWQDLPSPSPPVYPVGRGLLFKIIGTSYATAVEAVAVVAPVPVPETWWPGPQDIVVAAEAVEDPRNVGVLIRTAEAVGARGLVLDEACGDAYSRSAVRSSTGSILYLPIWRAPDLPAWLQEARSQGVRIIATSARARQVFWDADLTGRSVILVGNETAGLSPALRALADLEVAIPLYGAAHSLNVAVAAGVVLYECARQRRALLP